MRECSIDAVLESTALENISEMMKDEMNSMKDLKTAARLWLQYIEMVDILRRFIKAEQTGQWKLHGEQTQER